MIDLTPNEKRQLAETLGCAANEVQPNFSAFTEAATEEYIRMILGQRVFTRGSDIREYRMLLLLKHVYSTSLPSEKTISGLFQTSQTQSRALLRAVLSKYQYEVKSIVEATVVAELKSARPDPNDPDARLMTVNNANLIEILNQNISATQGTLPPIVRVPNSAATYVISPDTYRWLSSEFHL